MGTQDNDILGYFEGEHDQSGVSSPSTDNLFSNRTALERRLKCRLDREDLVVRGILPANQAAPNILAQIHQLERAKTGDILQKKIRVRSSRQQLVQRHILADSKVDASLQEKQTALERHRIADSLNEQLFNRPGPLELIRENILKVEPNFADAVKHGCVPFNPTCRDVSTSPVSNSNVDSPLSEVDGSRWSLDSLSPLASDSIDTFSQAFSDHVKVENFNVNNNNVSTAVSELEDCIVSTSDVFTRDTGKCERSKESLIRKQSKSSKKKQQSQNKQKIKKYKYHEYKPPGAVPATYQAPLDDRYKRLLEQQQMFLQLQVMKQNALFAAISGGTEQTSDDQIEMEESQTGQSELKVPATSIPAPACSIAAALDDLRVTELRSALRMRGLPVSGSKAKLLERLKLYEDRHRAECEDRSAEAVPFATAAVVNDSCETLPDAIPTSACTNAFIKVTTYASQNGETFQLVQAVPNMPTSEIQYHLVPSSVVLGQAQSNVQPFPVQHLGVGARQQSEHVVPMPASSQQVDHNLLSNIVSSAVTQSRQEGLPQGMGQGQPMNQSVSQPISPGHHIQVQFSQPSVNSFAPSSNLDIITAMDQSQPAVIDSMALQMLSNQIQQAVKTQTSNQTQTSHEAPESEIGSNSSLFNQLQKLKSQSTSTEDFGQKKVARNRSETSRDLSPAQSQQNLSRTYPWIASSNIQDKKDNHQAKLHPYNDLSMTFRSRSQTDPLRNISSGYVSNSTGSFCPVSGSLSSTAAMQGYNRSNSKPTGKDLRTHSLPSGVTDASMKNISRASDDLMDILGELSGSASTDVTEINTHGSHSEGIFDAVRRFPNNLQNGSQAKEDVSQFHARPTLTCPAGSHRPYGSFPGDLNMLGATLNESSNLGSGSLRCLSSRTSCTATNSHELAVNPMHITDVDMESGPAYFSNSNDLEWLNLNTFQSVNSLMDKHADKSQIGSKDEAPVNSGECLNLDVISNSLFENAKSSDALSIFDLDGSHSLMMVDSHESEKWDF